MPRAPYHIDRVYAYVAVDADGDEGIPAYVAANGMAYPLISADPHRLFTLDVMVEELEAAHGQKFKLIRLDHRHEVTDEEKTILMSAGEAEHKEECEHHESEDSKPQS